MVRAMNITTNYQTAIAGSRQGATTHLSGCLDHWRNNRGYDLLSDDGGWEVLRLGDFGVDGGGEGAGTGLNDGAGDEPGGGDDGDLDPRVAGGHGVVIGVGAWDFVETGRFLRNGRADVHIGEGVAGGGGEAVAGGGGWWGSGGRGGNRVGWLELEKNREKSNSY